VQNPQNTVTLYSYVVNGGSLDNKGLELLVKYELIPAGSGFFRSVKPFANAAFSDFKYVDYQYNTIGKDINDSDSLLINDYSGNQVAGVPPVVLNLGVDALTSIGLYANVYCNYRGAMYYTSDEARQADAFANLNAKLGYQRHPGPFHLDLHVGANNITSAQYYQMVFVNQLPDAYLPGPNKINFFAGLSVGYVF
jgi:iron complex outermembrane receptor protein